jgi:hypothetical protein
MPMPSFLFNCCNSQRKPLGLEILLRYFRYFQSALVESTLRFFWSSHSTVRLFHTNSSRSSVPIDFASVQAADRTFTCCADSIIILSRSLGSYHLNGDILLSITTTDCLIWAADRRQEIKSVGGAGFLRESKENCEAPAHISRFFQ